MSLGALSVSDADVAAWTKDEDRFEKLVALGADERTPEHERNAACREACRMVADKKITGWAPARGRMLKRALEEIKNQTDRLRRRF